MRLLRANVVEMRVLLEETGNEREDQGGRREDSYRTRAKPVPPFGASENCQVSFVLGDTKGAGAFKRRR